jgi:hypothetical protein
MIKSFAHFKRYVCVGMTLRCEHHTRPAISGARRIVKVQTNALVYEWTKPDGTVSKGWTHWPKSVDEIKVNDDGVTFLDGQGGQPLFTYHVTNEPVMELI